MKSLRAFPLLAALLGSSPQAVQFGGLDVTARGAAHLDPCTGHTEWPSGGTATDAGRGLALRAQAIQLRPGQSLLARQGTLRLAWGGQLSAAQLVYDLGAGTVTAQGEGGVTYTDSRLKCLEARQVVVYTDSGFVVASQDVTSAQPAFSAARFVFDPSTMQAALRGAAGQTTLLQFSAQRLSSVRADPGSAELGRFLPYL